jgi:hypothetical protein
MFHLITYAAIWFGSDDNEIFVAHSTNPGMMSPDVSRREPPHETEIRKWIRNQKRG